MKLSKTEQRVLLSIYIQGTMGKCGTLSRKQRGEVLRSLIQKGLLDDEAEVTKAGLELLTAEHNRVFQTKP